MDWLKDWNPDVLIVEANPRYLSTPAAVKWMHEHADARSSAGDWALRLSAAFPSKRGAIKLSCGQFDALIAYSQRGADEYADLGFPWEYLFVAHNAVSPAPRSMPQRPNSFGEKTVVILFVGRLQARKRIWPCCWRLRRNSE